jgi:hypothetical protein
VGLNSLKSLNLTNVYPNKKKKNKNNKVKSKPLELRSRVKINIVGVVRSWHVCLSVHNFSAMEKNREVVEVDFLF